MEDINLGINLKPEESSTCIHQVPGITSNFKFKIGDNEEVFTGVVIYPFGENFKYTTPVLAWINKDGKIYSVTYFLKEIIKIGLEFKGENLYRYFTLYGLDGKSQKVIVYKNVNNDEFDNKPLAVFKEEGSIELPTTHINLEKNYGKAIMAISKGDLNTFMELFKIDKIGILNAYPHLKNIFINIEEVYSNEDSLRWLDDHKDERINDSYVENLYIDDFNGLSLFFEQMYLRERRKNEIKYGKGILSIICKTFSYIPRDF